MKSRIIAQQSTVSLIDTRKPPDSYIDGALTLHNIGGMTKKTISVLALIAASLTLATFLNGGIPYVGKRGISSGHQTDDQTYAISGDSIMISGNYMVIEGLTCPNPETPNGRAAKALMNTYLRTNISCMMTSSLGGVWIGACKANGKSVAAGMIRAGYCE